jgi:acetyltransferase-like isoleucine patch superfamily enzyme
VHPTALVETHAIGSGTRIWVNVHIMRDVSIGPECNICDACFIESGVRIGRGVTVKIGAQICEGVTLEDGVFVGPGVVFTNDLRPRSPRLAPVHDRYSRKDWLRPTHVETGATIGANATIACGVTIGAWSFVGAGSVLLSSVPAYAFALGNPARPLGHVCICGEPISLENAHAQCAACARLYRARGQTLEPLEPIALWSETHTSAPPETLNSDASRRGTPQAARD